jgi:hypothetical protein
MNIPLTFESGPGVPYIQRWGKYNKQETLLDEFDEQFGYEDLEEIFEDFKEHTEYNFLTYNCHDFAVHFYIALYNYGTTKLKYVTKVFVYVPRGQCCTSLQMAAHFLKHLFLLPYRHFAFWNWHSDKKHSVVTIDESDIVELFDNLKNEGANNVNLKCKLLSR